jgi:hypothetical protein
MRAHQLASGACFASSQGLGIGRACNYAQNQHLRCCSEQHAAAQHRVPTCGTSLQRARTPWQGGPQTPPPCQSPPPHLL